ncbi:MAG: 5-formyltetrahydrofolate cyclo-ligase [Planctomycetes bacterium]|nr:5-formyltetrahydrofolate cyclo-ligase [Planctomycetota bacterium]
MSKTKQRKYIGDAIAEMTPEEKCHASTLICDRLMSIASVIFADTIFAYLPLDDEVNILQLLNQWIDESRTVGVPLVSWESKTMRAGVLSSLDEHTLKITRHGLREPIHRHPIPADIIDVILVPGMGFDTSGGRLGRGGGFYDRYLDLSRPPIVIGIAFDQQILESVQCYTHDQPMTAVVTPTRTLLN